MSDYEPKKGDRVRVVLEGTVMQGDAYFSLWKVVPSGNDDQWAWVNPEHMERLPDPDPEWQSGDVITISPTGVTLLRLTVGWICTDACGHTHSDTQVNSDWRNGYVTHLVRDGKPVTA